MVRGAVQQVWLPAATALVDQVAALATELRDVPMLARTHGQPATPTTLGKELAVLAHRLRRQLRRVERAEYLGKINGATGTYGAHVAAVPAPTGSRSSRSVRRAPGPDVEPADHPDRVARLAGRALRRRRPVQPDPAQPLHGRLDLHLAGLLRAGARPGHRRLLDDAAQGQPDPVRERRGQPRDLARAARRAGADAGHQPAAARPDRLLDPAQHRYGVRPLACWPSTTPGGGWPAWTPRPRRWPATWTPTGRCSARRCSRRCGPLASPGRRAWTSRTSGSRSSPADAAWTARRCATSWPVSGCPPTSPPGSPR